MVTNCNALTDEVQNKPVLLHITVAILAAILGSAYLHGDWSGPWWVFLSYSLFSIIAAVLRLGWVIPFSILGVVAGFLMTPIHGNSLEFPAYAYATIFLMFIGIIGGLVFDFVPVPRDEEQQLSPDFDEIVAGQRDDAE